MSSHPAVFPDAVLDVIGEHLPDRSRVLDPFAGTGRIHRLRPRCFTAGVELEPEWATLSPWTVVGDATSLPFPAGSFDAVATSPTYGNRMADCHDAKDTSTRITYRHRLGRRLHPQNSGQMQWGPAYRRLHERAWDEAYRVVRPGGLAIVNVKDHYRAGNLIEVSAWHRAVFLDAGWDIEAEVTVPTPGMRFGQNGSKRVDHEWMFVFRRPAQPCRQLRLFDGLAS